MIGINAWPYYDPVLYHLGFKCTSWVDTEYDANGRPENRKIWHDIEWPDGHITSGPWSPYVYPTREEFESHVEKILVDSK